MPSHDEISSLSRATRSYLPESLLPFWIDRSPDVKYGDFLTCFDRDGQSTGETAETFLMHVRILYTMASAHRAGYSDGRCAEIARAGAEFILQHYWDNGPGEWIWVADRDVRPTIAAKIDHGQCFTLYAFSEYSPATGEERRKGISPAIPPCARKLFQRQRPRRRTP